MTTPAVHTLSDIFFYAAETWDRPDYFQHKVDGAYRSVSMADFFEAGRRTALGLVTLGLKSGDRVAILSETRLEWAVADMGILTGDGVNVPIYPTLPRESVEYVLRDSGATKIFVSTRTQLKKVAAYAREHELDVILMDGEDASGWAISLAQLQERGAKLAESEPTLHRERAGRAKPEDLATIIYTSGTTGDPKGVMLSHGNITANVLGVQEALQIRETDRCLSFLPLSHILERMAGLYVMLYFGAGISYAESVFTVAENLLEVSPTFLISVPRFYEKTQTAILEKGRNSSAPRRAIFNWALGVGLRHSQAVLAGDNPGGWLSLQQKIAHGLVFKKIHAGMGGNLRACVSGGAPLNKQVALFFHSVGLPILEGYGLTETSPVIAVNTFERYKLGTVGPPIEGVEVRIAEDGEVVTKGPNVMMGYYNRPDDTEAVLVDGWFHTGDMGALDSEGFLSITDRKKDIIVTAGGKNVAPQPIEARLKADPFLAEVVVLGDSQPYLVALVLPDFEALAKWAKQHGFDPRPKALAKSPKVKQFLKARVDDRQVGLASYETIKRIGIIQEELTIDGGELTPTLKVKRRVVQEKFRELVESLYVKP